MYTPPLPTNMAVGIVHTTTTNKHGCGYCTHHHYQQTWMWVLYTPPLPTNTQSPPKKQQQTNKKKQTKKKQKKKQKNKKTTKQNKTKHTHTYFLALSQETPLHLMRTRTEIKKKALASSHQCAQRHTKLESSSKSSHGSRKVTGGPCARSRK